MKMVVLKNIPICATGIEYQLSTGPRTFTEEDLADAIAAAQEDPTVMKPRLKLGHIDGTWQAGEPNFGNYFNLHLSDNGQEILADLETLDWLAEVLPIVYPNRSIEADVNVSSHAGKRYNLVITAVSSLGVELPGVSSLDDLRDVLENPEVEVVDYDDEPTKVLVKASRMKAQVDATNVQRAFMEVVATGDRTWWWPRSIRLEPNEVIAEDEDTGDIYRIPFSIKGKDVEFSEPVKVYQEYVDAPASEQDQEPVAATRIAASWRSAAASRKGTNKENLMTPEELREKLGLESDATDEQVSARIAELTASQPDPDPDPDPNPDPDPDPDPAPDPEATPDPEPEAVAASTVLTDPAALRQLQEDARLGRQAREEQLKAHRKDVITKAVMAGKIPPARAKHWETLHQKDPQGTEETLAAMAEGVIPVELRGKAEEPESIAATGISNPDAHLAWLTPAERARVARHKQAQGVS